MPSALMADSTGSMVLCDRPACLIQDDHVGSFRPESGDPFHPGILTLKEEGGFQLHTAPLLCEPIDFAV